MNKDNEQREIKFRQPVEDQYGNFTLFHYWGFIDGMFVGPVGPFSAYNTGTGHSQQFTGLLDKNGKEIYEGDILYGRNRIKKIVEFDKKRAAFVYIEQFEKPHKISFAQMYDKFKSVFYQDGKLPNHEVIGHIYSSEQLESKSS